MIRFAASMTIFAAAAFALLMASPAGAAPAVTWVSATGEDSGECTRDEPCKTYAYAFTNTGTGGQINCVDAGQFGPLTITGSISVVCGHRQGGVDASASHGFLIDAPANSIVHLAGQSIDCFGANFNGIRLVDFGVILHIDDVQVRNCRPSSGAAIGIFPTSGNSELHMANSSSTDGNVGLWVKAAAGSIRVHVERTALANNTIGARIDTSGSGSIRGVIRDSAVFGGTTGVSATANGASLTLVLSNLAAHNNTVGLRSTGSISTLVVDRSQITANSTGISRLNGGKILSHGNNDLYGNTTNGVFTPPDVPLD